MMKICFEPWGELHPSKTLDSDLKNARSAKLTPTAPVDREKKTTTFSGSHGFYTTTLSTCVTDSGAMCGGLAQSLPKGLPCKHILRLAMELGLIDCDVESDPVYIKKPKEILDYDPLTAAVTALEMYPDQLREISYIMYSYQQHEKHLVLDIEPFRFFLDNNLLAAFYDFSDVEMPFRQKQCIDALESLRYEFPADLKLRREKYAYACAHTPEILPIICPNCAVLAPGDNIKNCFTDLFTYISFRLDHEESYADVDENGEIVSIHVVRDITRLKPKIQSLLRQYDDVYRKEF